MFRVGVLGRHRDLPGGEQSGFYEWPGDKWGWEWGNQVVVVGWDGRREHRGETVGVGGHLGVMWKPNTMETS